MAADIRSLGVISGVIQYRNSNDNLLTDRRR